MGSWDPASAAGAQAASEVGKLTKPYTYEASLRRQNATDAFYNIDTPGISQMRITLEKLVQQGIIEPEMAETFLQEASAYSQINPEYMESQMGALKELENVVDTDGMDPQSQAALYDLRNQTQSQERGGREAILQNAEARGVSGSGLELASQLANQQGSATSMANQGFQAAADANQRKMQAIAQVGQLGGQMYGQEAQAAEAQNAINQFNTANRQNIESQNVGVRNAAQAQNLAEKQRVADENVGLGNQQELYNKGLYQQDYMNKMAKAGGLASSNLGGADNALQSGNLVSAPFTQVASGFSNKWSDKNLKKDVEEFDSKSFLDELTGYKYKYKDPDKFGDGEQIGIMAQDLEKVAPEAVEDNREGKSIDYATLGPKVLATLADMNDRLSYVEGKK